MHTALNYLFVAEAAESHEASGGLFSALGIEWQLLIVQIVAFVLLVWLLGKFVYPWLMKSVDKRQADILAAAKSAEDAKVSAEDANKLTEKLLTEARNEASALITAAKNEAANISSSAEKKAKKEAERILEDGRAQIEKDLAAARRQLHNDTLDLVALATEKVVAGTHNKQNDAQLISKILAEQSAKVAK